jgi:phospholipase/carboxylesterase
MYCSEYKPKGLKKPSRLVIMLHGYGSNCDDLISIAPELANELPDTYFISPNAPFPFEGGGRAFQWFSLISREEPFMLEGARQAQSILNKFIDDQMLRFELSADQVALLGFSQGTMMSLHNSLRRSKPLAGILGYSGMLLADEHIAKEVQSKPKITLIHGKEDLVLPPFVMDRSKHILNTLGVDCEAFLINKLGHGIDEEGIKIGKAFLKGCFKLNTN